MSLRFLAGIMLACVLAIAANAQAAETVRSTNTKVMVSVKPIAMIYLALRPQQQVEVLLPSDRDMHEYQLSVGDIQRVQQAPLLFWLGPASEPFLQALSQRHSTRNNWVALAGNAGHAWLDKQQVVLMVDKMAKTLVQQYPEETTAIEARQKTLIAGIDQRFTYWQEQLHPYAMQPFILGHDAYRIFAADIGLSKAIIYRASNDHGHAQAGMQELMAIQQRIALGEIHCALEEPEVSFATISKRYSGLHLAQLDPLGAAIPLTEQAYFAFIDASASAFLACLQGK